VEYLSRGRNAANTPAMDREGNAKPSEHLPLAYTVARGKEKKAGKISKLCSSRREIWKKIPRRCPPFGGKFECTL
jgi:hypothetical protein